MHNTNEPRGRVTLLYGNTGAGKTAQIGATARWMHETTGKKTILCSADGGGWDAVDPQLVRDGVVTVEEMRDANPWVWIQTRFNRDFETDVGLLAIDSGTGIADALLLNASELAAQGVAVGQQAVYKLNIPKTDIVIGGNNKSQYGLIQTFLLRQLAASTRVASKGIDVLWTFGEHYPDGGDEPVIGPRVCGRALTGVIPRHVRYTLRILLVPEVDGPPKHLLITAPMMEADGIRHCVANSRAPLGVDIPTIIDPASLPEFYQMLPDRS